MNPSTKRQKVISLLRKSRCWMQLRNGSVVQEWIPADKTTYEDKSMRTRSSRLSSILLLLNCCFCFTSLRAQEVDTIYLLNHWSKSPQAGSSRAYVQRWRRAIKTKNFNLPKGTGWSFLRPAWRGIQDSIDLPVFRYHYRPYTYCIGVLRFFVKEEPIMLSREQFKRIRFTPT